MLAVARRMDSPLTRPGSERLPTNPHIGFSLEQLGIGALPRSPPQTPRHERLQLHIYI
jgi:hypothetical protein